ncbi:MAG: DUF483 domain-containing protein [Bacteroidetes bacterium]|nr:DUF483 domain-containing protein [Bacteroidota bacterium]
MSELGEMLSLNRFRELCDCLEFNKLVRMEIFLRDLSKIPEWTKKLNLNFTVSDNSFTLTKDKGMENWSSLLNYCSVEHREAMRLVYFHSDKEFCEIAKNLDTKNDDLNLGLLLNYPKCCIESYLQWQKNKENTDPITSITDSIPFIDQLNNYHFPNPFSRYFGSGLYSHFPCSINCYETKKIAQNSLNNLQVNFPIIADKILHLENSFVIFQQEKGVCLWSNFDSIANKIQLDKYSIHSQGELKSIFEKVNLIEISQAKLKLFSNSEVETIFKTNGCFIGTFINIVNPKKLIK